MHIPLQHLFNNNSHSNQLKTPLVSNKHTQGAAQPPQRVQPWSISLWAPTANVWKGTAAAGTGIDAETKCTSFSVRARNAFPAPQPAGWKEKGHNGPETPAEVQGGLHQ